MPISESTSVIIIEDNREYREVIKLALAEVDDLRLIESFATCEIGLRFLLDASTPQPDIVLLDLRLTGMMGMEAIPYIKDYSPDSKIIVLTQSDNETDVLKAISLGATGYLLKSETSKLGALPWIPMSLNLSCKISKNACQPRKPKSNSLHAKRKFLGS